MKHLLSVAICVVIAVCVPTLSNGATINHHRVARQSLEIPREFQNIRFENYLKNPRAVKFQLNCLIYEGPCDTIGKYLKNNIHGWLHTQCENCDEEQKKIAGKLIGFFQKGYPKEWNDAVKKYKGEFTEEESEKFQEELGLPLYVDVPEGGSPGKIDFEGLTQVVKEAKEILKTTDKPIILTQGGVQLTTPKGFDPDAAIKRVEALADKHLPALRTQFGTHANPKGTSPSTTTASEAPKASEASVEPESTNPEGEMTTGTPIA
jgi:hypothetical protein